MAKTKELKRTPKGRGKGPAKKKPSPNRSVGPTNVYHYLDEQSAKVLYAILRMQYIFDGYESDQLPGANLRRIEECTGIDSTTVSRKLIPLLEEAGYIVKAGIHQAEVIAATKGRDIYSLNVRNCITCKDSAALLVGLLEYYQQVQKNGNDPEGKIDTEEFVKYLTDNKRLTYLTPRDLNGSDRYRGKLDEFANSSEHIERISERYIRPRLKLYLERRYLALVAQCVPLEKLK